MQGHSKAAGSRRNCRRIVRRIQAPATDLNPPPSSHPVRDALRRATADLHARVDTSVPLGRSEPTLADYRDHLRLLLDWTEALRRLPVEAHRLDAQQAALQRDLHECDRWLGGAAAAPATAPATPAAPAGDRSSAAHGWGVAYVIEGSQLGGQVLYRRLAGPLAPHSLAYLKGAGPGTGARWTAFLAALDQQVKTPAQIESACAGAVDAFELLLQLQRARLACP